MQNTTIIAENLREENLRSLGQPPEFTRPRISPPNGDADGPYRARRDDDCGHRYQPHSAILARVHDRCVVRRHGGVDGLAGAAAPGLSEGARRLI